MHLPKNLSDAIQKISKNIGDLNNILQDEIFDSFALAKQKYVEEKIRQINRQSISRVFLGHHLEHCKPLNSSRELVVLPKEFLKKPLPSLRSGDVVLLTNNDVGSDLSTYVNLYYSNQEVFFVVWDWDAQHWVEMSTQLATHCDAYISANSENAFLLSHFNPINLGPVFVGTHQWSRDTIIRNFDVLLSERSDEPLGAHGFYSKYSRRNRAIATFGQTYTNVRFSSNQYMEQTELENLQEWSSHKVHFIAPVMGGVPIRVYNALITGGIPLLPSFYKSFPESSILGNVPVYYDVFDLIDPKEIVSVAINKFNLGGEKGLMSRVLTALETHHIDPICEIIFRRIEGLWNSALNKTKYSQFGYRGLERTFG